MRVSASASVKLIGRARGLASKERENWQFKGEGKKHGIDRAIVEGVDGFFGPRPDGACFHR